jgi:hypothetical protein
MNREEVYKLIDGEREYQTNIIEKSPARHDGHKHTPGDYITMLSSYVNKLQQAWTDNGGNEPALDIMRKCAGIAVHCMEDHGAPPRKFE